MTSETSIFVFGGNEFAANGFSMFKRFAHSFLESIANAES